MLNRCSQPERVTETSAWVTVEWISKILERSQCDGWADEPKGQKEAEEIIKATV